MFSGTEGVDKHLPVLTASVAAAAASSPLNLLENRIIERIRSMELRINKIWKLLSFCPEKKSRLSFSIMGPEKSMKTPPRIFANRTPVAEAIRAYTAIYIDLFFSGASQMERLMAVISKPGHTMPPKKLISITVR